MKPKKAVIQGYKEMQVPYSLVQSGEKTNALAIFMPGSGYTNQRPLFHFSEGIFLNQGADVLEIDYRYKEKDYDHFDMEELSKAIQIDVKTVIDQVLRESSYDEFYLVAKSLGTIALCTELKRADFKNARVVWFTPLIHRDDVLQAMVESPQAGLCFIGDNDPCYSASRYNQLENNTKIIAHLLPGITHDMEYVDQPIPSIDVLKEIMKKLSQFAELEKSPKVARK